MINKLRNLSFKYILKISSIFNEIKNRLLDDVVASKHPAAGFFLEINPLLLIELPM
jgi:hypothetical protein